MPTPNPDAAPPEMTARWLRVVATDLRIRSMTALPNDDFDLYAIAESLDELAEQLDPQTARHERPVSLTSDQARVLTEIIGYAASPAHAAASSILPPVSPPDLVHAGVDAAIRSAVRNGVLLIAEDARQRLDNGYVVQFGDEASPRKES